MVSFIDSLIAFFSVFRSLQVPLELGVHNMGKVKLGLRIFQGILVGLVWHSLGYRNCKFAEKTEKLAIFMRIMDW